MRVTPVHQTTLQRGPRVAGSLQKASQTHLCPFPKEERERSAIEIAAVNTSRFPGWGQLFPCRIYPCIISTTFAPAFCCFFPREQWYCWLNSPLYDEADPLAEHFRNSCRKGFWERWFLSSFFFLFCIWKLEPENYRRGVLRCHVLFQMISVGYLILFQNTSISKLLILFYLSSKMKQRLVRKNYRKNSFENRNFTRLSFVAPSLSAFCVKTAKQRYLNLTLRFLLWRRHLA